MKKIPQLDAIRGLAVLLVLLHNTDRYPSLHLHLISDNGWMGVDLFFVLSGFLITGVLFDTKHSEGYFRNFYARRCLRIWPLYYSVLFLMFVAIPLLRPSIGAIIITRSSPWWSYLLFLQNFLVSQPTSSVGPLSTTWSLAIEEQFYLVWAVVVRFCSYAQLRSIAISVICLSPILRVFLAWHHVDLYPNVFCRLDGLMAGGFLALLVRSKTFLAPRFLKAAWSSLLIALSLAIVTESFRARWITYSLSTVASASFVYLALFATQRWFQIAMRSRTLIHTGVISYGLYLLHKLPFDAEEALNLGRYSIPALLVGLAVSYVIATASWFLFEKPLLKLKRFFEFRPVRADGGDGQFAPVAS